MGRGKEEEIKGGKEEGMKGVTDVLRGNGIINVKDSHLF